MERNELNESAKPVQFINTTRFPFSVVGLVKNAKENIHFYFVMTRPDDIICAYDSSSARKKKESSDEQSVDARVLNIEGNP